MDFRGFDLNIISMLRGGILMSIGDFPEILSQAMLVGCNVSREIGSTELPAGPRRPRAADARPDRPAASPELPTAGAQPSSIPSCTHFKCTRISGIVI